MRLDHWLKKQYPALTNRHISEAIDGKLVLSARGAGVKKGQIVEEDPDCSKLDRHLLSLRKGNLLIEGVEVLHTAKDFLVIDKPAGLPSHPLSLFDDKTVTAWAFAAFPLASKDWKSSIQPTLCPHRLDTDTSGLLIVCLTLKSYEKWRELFSKKKLTKTYRAWCWGKPKKGSFEASFDLAHHPKDFRRMVAIKSSTTKHRPPILKAKTTFTVVQTLEDRFLVAAEMKTGVTHQVRAHLSAQGFPLVGDELYDEAFEKRSSKQKGHLLRATKIEGEGFRFEADSDSFEKL